MTTPAQATNGDNKYYKDTSNNVFESGTNRAIALPEFQSLGLNIDHINPQVGATGVTQALTTPQMGLSKVGTGSVGPDGKPIYDVFAGQEHIADPNDPRLKGVDISTLADSQAPQGFKSKFEQGFNKAQSAGTGSPTTGGAGASLVQSNVTSDPAVNNLVDTTTAANVAHQKYLDDYTQARTSLNQHETLSQEYARLTQEAGLPAINTKLLNMKNVMDGSEDDLRNEITKAGGFATNSQVLALTNARNKTMIQNYNNLLQTRDDMQKNLDTIIGLSEKDRAYASAQIDKQLNFDLQQQTYADKMLTNAQDSLNTTAKTFGWDAVLQSALATGDPQAVQRINSTMGNGFDLATMAKGNNIDQQIKEANLAHTIAETRKINFDMKQGGGGGINTTVPISNDSGSTSYVPTNLLPYYNVSSSGVEYIDASTLQGTAAQKTALVNEASKAGYKVITNKNTAADLVNIKDANSKLDSISTIMAGIGQPGWISRSLYGLGLTKLATLTQSDPQKAAAGALQSIGLDILKAISGVQGFRGNQTAVQQVTDHLPKITDTVDTINKKISYIRTLISDREDAAVGKPKVNVIPADQVPAGYYQASDGLLYKK